MTVSNQSQSNVAARGVALAVVILHVVLPELARRLDVYLIDQAVLALAGLVAVLCLDQQSPAALGFRLIPQQGWKYWIRIGVWFGLAVLAFAGAVTALIWLMGWPIPIVRQPPSVQTLLFFCVTAPVGEEIVYRSLLVFALLPTCGEVLTIVIGGVVFALIHILGGNPGPDNQVAGFLLTWAFVRSRTILVPLAMHSAGNLYAYASHVAGWYLVS